MREALVCLVLVSGCDLVFDIPPAISLDASPPDPGCPSGFDGRYLFVDEPNTEWRTAEARCEVMDPDLTDGVYVHLAVIGTAQEGINLQQRLVDQRVSVGLSDRPTNKTGIMPDLDRANYVWVTQEPVGVPPWKSDNPNSDSSPPYCGTLDNGEIDDSGCNTDHPFVCECDEFPALPELIDP